MSSISASQQTFIDASNVWYLISGISGESINNAVIKDNEYDSGSHVFDASLAFVSNGNDGAVNAGDTYTDISAVDVRLKSAVKNGVGLPFSKGNWAKIDDLDGKLGASVGAWVLTKKKLFDGEYNVIYGLDGTANIAVYGKALEEDNNGTNISFDPSSTIVFYNAKNGVTPTNVDGSIIVDVSGTPNNNGFFNRSCLVGAVQDSGGTSDPSANDFITYNLTAAGGSKYPIYPPTPINDLSGGLQCIDYCFGTSQGNYLLAVGAGNDPDNKVIYKLTWFDDMNPLVIKERLTDLESVIFSSKFTQVLDITWIKHPTLNQPRWFFCGETGDATKSVYYFDDLSGGNLTACNTPTYTGSKYPLGISSTETLDNNNPRSCPIGLVGNFCGDFTRNLDNSGNSYTFDKGIDSAVANSLLSAKKCRMIQVQENIVKFIIASQESNYTTINLDQSGNATDQEFFYDSSGSSGKVPSENLTYLPQANHGNGLIAFGSYVGSSNNKVFIFELKKGSVVNANNPNISTFDSADRVQAITLIKNRYNVS